MVLLGSETSQPESETPDRPLVECRSVTKEYTRGGSRGGLLRKGSEGQTIRAVDDVSLSIEPGDIVGIQGPSGSGKSTLLHLLAALDVPSTGTVRLQGTDTSTLGTKGRAKLRRTSVGMIFQRFHLLPGLSARANVTVPMIEAGYSSKQRKRRGQDLLEAVDLEDRANHTPGELSGGEQQRVAIARALALDPPLIIADEPTGELDTETGQTILNLLSEVAEEKRAVVLASHDQSAQDIATRVITLRDGMRVDERT